MAVGQKQRQKLSFGIRVYAYGFIPVLGLPINVDYVVPGCYKGSEAKSNPLIFFIMCIIIII